MLAHVLAHYPDEVRADLQQYYGIDIDLAQRDGHTAYHVAVLVSQLPVDSRVARAQNLGDAWSQTDILLGIIATSVRDLMHSLAGGKGKRPDPILPERMRSKKHGTKMSYSVVGIDEMKKYLQNKGLPT